MRREHAGAEQGMKGERAKARGVRLGRKPTMTDHQKREAIRRRDRNGEPVREIARSYNVSHSTISRLAAWR
jgi:DNA invertase Pin-like site-specific DNA recombinase